MAGEARGHTLQATALVHEAWLRLVGDAAPALILLALRGPLLLFAIPAGLLAAAGRKERLHRLGEHRSNEFVILAGPPGARVQSSPPQNNPPKTQPSIRSTSALFNEMFDE
jgi:hypothetical protein